MTPTSWEKESRWRKLLKVVAELKPHKDEDKRFKESKGLRLKSLGLGFRAEFLRLEGHRVPITA